MSAATFDALLAGLITPGLFVWDGDPERDLVGEAADAGWQAWELDTSGIGSPEAFYEEVRAAWGLPPWFGDNLDALYDVLAERAAGPALVIWDASAALGASAPDFAARVVSVLRDTIEEADSFAVVLRGESVVSATDVLR